MIIPPIFILCTPFSFIDFISYTTLYFRLLLSYLFHFLNFFLSPHLFCLLYSIGFFFNWFVRAFTSGKHEHASDKHHLNQTLPLEKLTCLRETEKERKWLREVEVLAKDSPKKLSRVKWMMNNSVHLPSSSKSLIFHASPPDLPSLMEAFLCLRFSSVRQTKI